MKSARSNIDYKIGEAALRLIGKSGWDKFTLDALAKAAKIPAVQIHRQCANKNAALPLIVSAISAQTFESCGKPDKNASVHDRLFETLMARFDVLQQHRKAILSITEAARRDASLLFVLMPAQIKAMKESIRFLRLEESKTCPQLQPLALWGVFMFAAHIWKTDETLDMSKTMAALDRALRLADKAVTILRVKART